MFINIPIFPSGKQLHNIYILDNCIGEGSFGRVYKAYKKDTQEVVAVKQILRKALENNEKLQELYNQELSLLSTLSSENIVKYIDNFNTADSCYVVTEYCNQGDLCKILSKSQQKKLSEQRVTSYIKQLLNGFKELHKYQVAHRDLKPENILVNNNTLKLADLGFAKSINSVTSTVCGSYTTMAPEVLEGKPYGIEVDIYSLGVVLYKLIYGEYPYRSDVGNLKETFKQKIKEIKYEVPGVNISDSMKDLLKSMICYDRHKRIKWDEIYQHPIIQTNTLGVSVLLPAGSVLLASDNNQEAAQLYKKFKHLMLTDSNIEEQNLKPTFKIMDQFKKTVDVDQSNETSHASEIEAMRLIEKQQLEKEQIWNCIQDASLKYYHYKQILKHVTTIDRQYRNKIVQFVLSKKAYNMTFKMENALNRGNNLFDVKYFEDFKNDQNYQNIKNDMLGDVKDFEIIYQSSKNDVKNVFNTLNSEQLQRKEALLTLLTQELNSDQLTNNYEELLIKALSYDYQIQYKQLENSNSFNEQTKDKIYKYFIFINDLITQQKEFQQAEFNFAGYYNKIQSLKLVEAAQQFKQITQNLAEVKL